jgi:hypothetical protein
MKLTPLQLANYIEKVGEQYQKLDNNRTKKRFERTFEESKQDAFGLDFELLNRLSNFYLLALVGSQTN